jgi:hypothetical protein
MQSRTRTWISVAFLFAALSMPTLSAAFEDHDHQATFTTFGAPGSAEIDPQSINPHGAITGWYVDAGGTLHGFLRESRRSFMRVNSCDRDGYEKDCAGSNAVFTTFDPLGAASTQPLSINPDGDIAGVYTDTNNNFHGFVRTCHRDGREMDCEGGNAVITTFEADGAVDTVPASINPKGAITGYYVDANNVYHGFVRDCDRDKSEKDCDGGNAVFTTFDPPGAVQTFPQSINPKGMITGYYVDANNSFHGFVRDCDRTNHERDCEKGNGIITTFDVPGAGTDEQGTFPASMNANGTITGYYIDANNTYHGFVRDCDRDGHEKDCEGSNAIITKFDAPDAITASGEGTFAVSINPKGAIAGFYWGTDNLVHSFIRDCDRHGHEKDCEEANGIFTIFNVPGESTSVGQGTLAVSINPKGATTGYYFDTNYSSRGFVRDCDRECNGDE